MQLRSGEFWANREISFEIPRGECLGIIGHNGAGKTTLLKLLNGLLRPDVGRIEMTGRVGAMIALGAGFNPILSGRENIYINGAILGLTRREIERQIDEIIDFAELAHAIDAPVRTYSSGMNVRLGFAIASSLKPDILIIDEVLAVGDTDFRIKCMKRMRNIVNNGCAVILVSHSMTDIRNLATQVLWLKNGSVCQLGKPAEVITNYLGTTQSNSQERAWEDETAPGTKSARLRRLSIKPPTGHKAISIESGSVVTIEFDCFEEQLKLGYTLEVSTEEQIIVFHTGGPIMSKPESRLGRYRIHVEIPPNLLNAGTYNTSIIIDDSQTVAITNAPNAATFRVEIDPIGANYNQLPGIISPKLSWTLEFENTT